MQPINEELLGKAARATETAKITLRELFKRERHHSNLHLGRFKSEMQNAGLGIKDEEFRQLWKDLQAAKAGRVEFGPRGALLRFHWDTKPQKLANMLRLKRSVPAAAPAPGPGALKDSTQQLLTLYTQIGEILYGIGAITAPKAQVRTDVANTRAELRRLPGSRKSVDKTL